MRRRDSYGYGSDDGYGDEMDEEEMRMMMRDMSPGERRMYMEEMEMGRRGKGGPPGMRDPRMRDMDPVMVTAIRLCIGSVLTTIVALLFSDFSLTNISVGGYISIVYAALIGALAGQFLAFYIIGRFGATSYSLTTYVIPVVATIFGVVLLGEIVTWGMLVGVFLIGGGIYLINRRVEPQPKPVSVDVEYQT